VNIPAPRTRVGHCLGQPYIPLLFATTPSSYRKVWQGTNSAPVLPS